MAAISHQCTMCTEDDPATSFCSTCGKFICEFCQKAHKRLVDFRDHKYTPLSEIDQVDKVVATAELPSYCTLHSGEVLKLYCKTCQMVICRDCTIVNHRSHEYGFINELRPQVQQGVKTTIARLQTKQKEFTAHLGFLKDMETSRNAHSTSLENEITLAFDSYIEALKTRQAELLSIEQASKESDLKQIWAQKQHIETTLANLSSGIRYAERLCSCPSDMLMLMMQGEAIARLNSLQSTIWNASDVEISVPNTFSKTELRLSEACALEPDLVTVSIRMETQSQGYLGAMVQGVRHETRGLFDEEVEADLLYASHSNVKLGKMVHYIIEVKNQKANSHSTPSISICTNTGSRSSTMQENRILYTTRYHGDGVWSLTFTPPHTGSFSTTVSVYSGGVSSKETIGNNRAMAKQSYGGFKAAAKRASKCYPSQSASHTIRVNGALKVGDIVCRGPHWGERGDDDGGLGGLGTVTDISMNQSSGSAQVNPWDRHRKQRFVEAITSDLTVSVKWENGRVGEYKAQDGCFEIELAPIELRKT